MKFKTTAIVIHGGHFNQGNSMIFRQFASVAGCERSFILAQTCGPRISEFWPKPTFLLEQQIKSFHIGLNQPKRWKFDLHVL